MRDVGAVLLVFLLPSLGFGLEWNELEAAVPSIYYKTVIHDEQLWSDPGLFQTAVSVARQNLNLFVKSLYARQNFLRHFSSCSCVHTSNSQFHRIPASWSYEVEQAVRPVDIVSSLETSLRYSLEISKAFKSINHQCPLSKSCFSQYDPNFAEIMSGIDDALILEYVWQDYLPKLYPTKFDQLFDYDVALSFKKTFREFLRLFSSTKSEDIFGSYDSEPFHAQRIFAPTYPYHVNRPSQHFEYFSQFYPQYYSNFGFKGLNKPFYDFGGSDPNFSKYIMKLPYYKGFNSFVDRSDHSSNPFFRSFQGPSTFYPPIEFTKPIDVLHIKGEGIRTHKDGTFKVDDINGSYHSASYQDPGKLSAAVLSSSFTGPHTVGGLFSQVYRDRLDSGFVTGASSSASISSTSAKSMNPDINERTSKSPLHPLFIRNI